MDTSVRNRSSHLKTRVLFKKQAITDDLLLSAKSLQQSRKDLCNVTTGEYHKEADLDCLTEITFVCINGLTEEPVAAETQVLAAVSLELPELLKSLHVYSLKKDQVIFLKDRHAEAADSTKPQVLPGTICVMRLSPTFLRINDNTIFTLLCKYSAGLRYAMETDLIQKYQQDVSHADDDDTNQSVSSIEDDFVTAFEHLDEDLPLKYENLGTSCCSPRNQRDVASQTLPSHCLGSSESRIIVSCKRRKSSVISVPSLVGVLESSELPINEKNSVTTLVSDPGRQRSFYRPCNPSGGINVSQKSALSFSPTESEDSECSSPSPVIFLDEEGYQKSLKANLKIPKIPVLKDGIEDSDSELSEFFDSFDQLDELDQTIESISKPLKQPTSGSQMHKKKFPQELKIRSTAAAMNPHKFDRSILPANVRKPTPRKPESSSYSNLSDVPDSPRLVKTSADDSGALFSPIRSSAFSPLGTCNTTEHFWKFDSTSGGGKPPSSDALYKTYSDYANNVSDEILGSIFDYRTLEEQNYEGNFAYLYSVCSKSEEQLTEQPYGESLDKKHGVVVKPKQKSQVIKGGIQKFATELVEKSFHGAFKEMQKGVSSCTNALCHLAGKLTSSIFQMAFHEIGLRRALALKKRALNGLANFLVGEAITGALQEFQFVKKQIFNNAVARFAADLAEELVFEGIMEVCQFSHPPTPMTSVSWPFDSREKVVRSYAKDLSESVLQEAFIELSQVDVPFTTQAAISVSLDNIQYVSAESMAQAAQTCTSFHNFQDRMQTAFDVMQSVEKESTVQKALLCASGIASSVSVPLAGTAFSQKHILSDLHQVKPRTFQTSEPGPKLFRGNEQKTYPLTKRIEELPIRNIQLNEDCDQSASSGAQPFCNHGGFKLVNCSTKEHSTLQVNTGKPNIQDVSGTMVDFIVSEAYELMTSSKARKTVEEYADQLSKKIVDRKPSCSSSIDELTHKNLYTDQFAKYLVTYSMEEDKATTVENENVQTYAEGLQLNTMEDTKRALQSIGKQREELKLEEPSVTGEAAARAMEQKEMLSKSPDLLRAPPVSPAECSQYTVVEVREQFAQELKGHLAEEFPPSTPPPSPTVSVSKLRFSHSGGASSNPELAETLIRSLSEQFQSSKVEHPAQPPSNVFSEAKLLEENSPLHTNKQLSQIRSNSLNECVSQLEYCSRGVRRNSTSPPHASQTAQMETQLINTERTLKGFIKGLKGECLSAASPPIVHNTAIYSLSEIPGDKEEKTKSTLKEIKSPSGGKSGEGEKGSDMVFKKYDASEKTESKELSDSKICALQYADRLAGCVVSFATEMAAFCLDDKNIEGGNNKRYPFFSLLNESNGYPAFLGNFSEQTLKSIWSYAGEVAVDVINDAKKVASTNQHKINRPSKINWRSECHKPRNENKEKLYLTADQCSQEPAGCGLPLPQTESIIGLSSRYPSCESVTDEYAEHIIRVLRREGGNSELIMDQYATRLVYRSIKAGLQQAARKVQQKYNKKLCSLRNSVCGKSCDLFRLLTKEPNQAADTRKKNQGSCNSLCKDDGDEALYGKEYIELINFADSLAYNITCDVRQKLQMSAVRLPKSLTDSCLYKRSQLDEVAEDLIKNTFSSSFLPFTPKNKLYHSTSSLNDYGEGVIQVVEQYARKVVDDTLEMSLGSAHPQVAENKRKLDRLAYSEKLSGAWLQPASAHKACTYCSIREHPSSGNACGNSRQQLHELHNKRDQPFGSKSESCCHNSRSYNLDIPKIHIDLEQKNVLAEEIVTVAVEQAKRELSSTSLTADSGIGHDGVSFAESLTAEVVTSAVTNASQAVSISACRDGFRLAESAVSQQLSLSVGDDSTGSWSNLSFEDEHPDESSSFLHLSDSNGNSSSWSSLGLEGDMYEENISFPPSDSDGAEDKEEEHKDDEGLVQIAKTLLVVNVDVKHCDVDPELRMALQWIAASQSELSVLYFSQPAEQELMLLPTVVKRLRNKNWKVGDLLQAVLKYCEDAQQASKESSFLQKSLFDWLLEHA
ncbi:A-kinase anchor protein 11 isoform X2 [Latimeria chalumnae]|uniref:A-kinase anchor protein 11 isoform X2 n=1 Tax=Latimeria chalumnae TaxID=7897 RepID=UPI0003C17056|nr:PREDICTED: A-kinase anchor protein 11 isoform X2 [Latimeria chalumnae]|eukprot:XP_006010263.1 PREDICTED: A-kinase anchor protein 11 isoform X2 [Latimeria chalumnae]